MTLKIPLILNKTYCGKPVVWNPQPVHWKIMGEIFKPEPHTTKLIDVVCGISVGKTAVGCVSAIGLMEKYQGIHIQFLQPNYRFLMRVFWAEFQKWAPPSLYKVRNKGKPDWEVEWYNGSMLYPSHRWVSGNQDTAADLQRGMNLDVIFDDEAAIGFNPETYTNSLGRLRVPGDVSGIITLSTPKVGPYGDLLAMPGHRIIRARTIDNAANQREGFEASLRSQMSELHARRELDGEMVALEGIVWSMWRDDRNISPFVFQRGKPYILAGDIGVQSSWLCCQPDNRGALVVVSEYHADDGGTRDDMREVLRLWGQPAKIITGTDVNTVSQVSGETAAIEIKRTMSSLWMVNRIPIVTPSEVDQVYRDKSIQYHAMSDAIESGRLKLSVGCTGMSEAVHGNKNRSFYKMIQQDAWPKPGASGWFVKDKRKSERGSGNEDVRDAALYLSVVEFPPRIGAQAA